MNAKLYLGGEIGQARFVERNGALFTFAEARFNSNATLVHDATQPLDVVISQNNTSAILLCNCKPVVSDRETQELILHAGEIHSPGC